jgi:hypothetical protein
MTQNPETPTKGARTVDRNRVLAARLEKHAYEKLKRPVPPEVEELAAIDPFSVPYAPARPRTS